MAVNMLLSYALSRGDDLGKYRAQMPCGRLMVDSGAFTAMTTGKPVELQAYADYLTRWSSVIDHAVTLDVIGDPAGTMANTRKLHQLGHNVMPVFTRGGKLAEFDAMVRDCGYVCIGGGVGMKAAHLVPRLAGLQRRAEELGGGIHALGLGNMTGIRRVRPYSADASNVSASFIYGNLVCYDGRHLRSVPHLDRRRVRGYLQSFADAGIASSVAEVLRTGRQPKGQGRVILMRGQVLAGAAADEDAQGLDVPVPQGVGDTPGTHMYMAVTGGFLAPATASTDQLIHDPTWTPPPLWVRHREQHAQHCRARERTPA